MAYDDDFGRLHWIPYLLLVCPIFCTSLSVSVAQLMGPVIPVPTRVLVIIKFELPVMSGFR